MRRLATDHPGPVVIGVASIPRAITLLIAVGHHALFVGGDTDDYLAMADHLSGYTDARAHNWDLGFMRTPGFPMWLAPLRAIGHTLFVPGLAQAMIGVAACWLTYRLGRRLAGPTVGLLAGVWLAVDPVTVVQAVVLLTEIPFSAVLLLAMLCTVRVIDGASWHWAALAGFLLGYAALLRPIALYLPLVLVPVVVLVSGRNQTLRRTCARGAVLLGVVGLVSGAWIVRNEATSGVTTFSTVQGVNLLDYRAAGAIAQDKGISLAAARTIARGQLAARVRPGMNRAQVARQEQHLGTRLILEHPKGYLIEAAEGLVRTSVGPDRSRAKLVANGLPRSGLVEGALLLTAMLSAIAMSIGSALGTVVALTRRSWVIVSTTVVPLAYLLIVGSGTEADARFRGPIAPLMVILSAYAVVDLLRRRRTRAHVHDRQDVTGAVVGERHGEHPSIGVGPSRPCSNLTWAAAWTGDL